MLVDTRELDVKGTRHTLNGPLLHRHVTAQIELNHGAEITNSSVSRVAQSTIRHNVAIGSFRLVAIGELDGASTGGKGRRGERFNVADNFWIIRVWRHASDKHFVTSSVKV